MSDIVDSPPSSTCRHCFGATRFAVLFIVTICISLLLSNTLTLNFTIICMNNNSSSSSINETLLLYDYSPIERALLFSIVAVGTLIGAYPSIWLISNYSHKRVLIAFGALSTVATVALPLAADLGGFPYLMAARFVQGFAASIVMPIMGTMTERWSTLAGNGFYIAFLTCCLQFGPMFTMFVSGALCTSSLGWPSVYYVHAMLSAGCFGALLVYYQDAPQRHRCVSHRELQSIEFGKERIPKRTRVPYTKILSSMSIISIFIVSFGGFFGYQLLLQYGPIYLNQVLHYEIESTGIATAIPYVLSFLLKFVAGFLSDRIVCIGERVRVVFFTTLSMGTMSICFVLLALFSQSHANMAQLAFTIAIVAVGLNSVGVMKSSQLVARHHNHFVMGIVSIINSISILLLPLIVGVLAPNNLPSEWSIIFIATAAAIIASTCVFFCFGDGKAAEWTKIDVNQQMIAIVADETVLAANTDDEANACLVRT